MTGDTYRSVGVRGPEIVAVSADLDGLDDLAGLTPAFTIVGGRATHDPDKRLAR